MTADSQMRGVVVPRNGGAGVLELRELPVPEPGPGQLLLRVAASGVNFKDVYLREGVYPTDPPFGLGEECAGRVVAAGAGVDAIAEGDLVATASGLGGTHADYALVDAAAAVPVPDGVGAETAAAVMLQGLTAHYLVTSVHPLVEGEWALVHAAAGGVGQLLVQLAKARGAHVVATVGSEAKATIPAALGADHVLRTDTGDDLAGAVREIVPDGVHVVYDGVGKATFEDSLKSLRRRGMLGLFGAASGQVPPFDLQRLNPLGSLFVTRPTLGDYLATREELTQRAGELFATLADGSLQVAIGGRYGLADAAQAYRDLEGRRTTGKLLILP